MLFFWQLFQLFFTAFLYHCFWLAFLYDKNPVSHCSDGLAALELTASTDTIQRNETKWKKGHFDTITYHRPQARASHCTRESNVHAIHKHWPFHICVSSFSRFRLRLNDHMRHSITSFYFYYKYRLPPYSHMSHFVSSAQLLNAMISHLYIWSIYCSQLIVSMFYLTFLFAVTCIVGVKFRWWHSGRRRNIDERNLWGLNKSAMWFRAVWTFATHTSGMVFARYPACRRRTFAPRQRGRGKLHIYRHFSYKYDTWSIYYDHITHSNRAYLRCSVAWTVSVSPESGIICQNCTAHTQRSHKSLMCQNIGINFHSLLLLLFSFLVCVAIFIFILWKLVAHEQKDIWGVAMAVVSTTDRICTKTYADLSESEWIFHKQRSI